MYFRGDPPGLEAPCQGPQSQRVAHKLDMEKNVKLIWDFRGPDALRVAEHYRVHLVEALSGETGYETGTGEVGPGHSIAYLVVPESEMRPWRDRLKPHRGEYVTP